MDWFRVATDRKEWRRVIKRKWPERTMDRDTARRMNTWMPGRELPQVAHPLLVQAVVGAVEPEEEGLLCPVCGEAFITGNARQAHYEDKHSIRDPELVTSISHQCPQCKGFMGRQVSYHLPECPARLELRRILETVPGRWPPMTHGPA